MYTPYAGDVGNITAHIGEIPYLETEMDTVVIQFCVQRPMVSTGANLDVMEVSLISRSLG
jgi:hypothetical protein